MPRIEDSPESLAKHPATERVDSLLRAAVELSEPAQESLPRRGLVPHDIVAGRFVVERLAGSGGMGTIYCAKDLHTQRRVAIKVLRRGDAQRFAQEAAVLSALSHPAIVRYNAHGITASNTQFIAMEWLEGEDLAQRLLRAPLSVLAGAQLVCRACEGVAAAHSRGVVHRDLKPSNLFLVDREPALLKVLDFGIARLNEGVRVLTRSGAVLGTVGYMAPEQAMGAQAVDARADVFALGCVLFASCWWSPNEATAKPSRC